MIWRLLSHCLQIWLIKGTIVTIEKFALFIHAHQCGIAIVSDRYVFKSGKN